MDSLDSTRHSAGSPLSPSRSRKPAARKAGAVAARPTKQGVRSLKEIQEDLAELDPKVRAAQAPFLELAHRFNELAKERDTHPDTLAAGLANLRLGTKATWLAGEEPELGAVLTEIAGELELARAVVQTARQAIENSEVGDFVGLEAVLRTHADDSIADCIDRLHAAIENARLRGSRIVVTKAAGDTEAAL